MLRLVCTTPPSAGVGIGTKTMEARISPRDYARHLRAIGQDLENLHLSAFNLECTGNAYLVWVRSDEQSESSNPLFRISRNRLQKLWRNKIPPRVLGQEEPYKLLPTRLAGDCAIQSRSWIGSSANSAPGGASKAAPPTAIRSPSCCAPLAIWLNKKMTDYWEFPGRNFQSAWSLRRRKDVKRFLMFSGQTISTISGLECTCGATTARFPTRHARRQAGALGKHWNPAHRQSSFG